MTDGQKEVRMKKRDVIRAWRDGEYYSSLSKDERAELPESPASAIDLGDEVLATVTGGCSYANGYCPTSTVCSPCPPARFCP
jgi:mersacidin/lichenicidin family type 2 lantibiotic